MQRNNNGSATLPKAITSNLVEKDFKVTDVPTTSSIDSFFQAISTEQGLVVSLCKFEHSGCHIFARKFDYMRINSARVAVKKNENVQTFHSESSRNEQFKYVMVTGCVCDATLVKALGSQYDFTQVAKLFYLPPPHYARFYLDDFNYEEALLQKTYNSLGCQTHLIISGVNFKLPNCIGLPNLISPSLSESNYVIPENCLGLMYISRIDRALKSEIGNAYLANYIATITRLAAAKKLNFVTVIAIGVEESIQSKFSAKMMQAGINIQFEKILPAADYLKAVKQVIQNDGMFAFDGTMALKEVLLLGGKVLVYAFENNVGIYNEMIDMLESSNRDTARVILGLKQNDQSPEDSKSHAEVYQEMQKIIRADVEKCQRLYTERVAKSSNATVLRQIGGLVVSHVAVQTNPRVESRDEHQKSGLIACSAVVNISDNTNVRRLG